MSSPYDNNGHARDDAETPCPRCGFVRVALPAWANVPHALFAMDGSVWRVIATASTNRDTPQNSHFREYVSAELVDGDAWKLPEPGSSVRDLVVQLERLRQAHQITAEQLHARALRLLSQQGRAS